MPFELDGPSIKVNVLGPQSGFLVIDTLRTSGVAPFGAVFRARWLGDDDGHDTADFIWDFDDESATFANYDTANCPLANDRNVAYTALVNHTFRTPGSYTVSCTSRRADGETKTATVQITVSDPDTVEWAKDVFVSFANEFGEAPSASGTVKHITSREALAAEIGTQANARVRLRFRAGETFDVLEIKPQEHRLFWAGAFDTGTAPKLIQSRGAAEESNLFWILDCPEVCISGLEFESGYDPVAGEYDTDFTRMTGVRATSSETYLTATGIKAAGLLRPFYTSGQSSVFDDCDLSNWADYGAYSTARNLGLAGGLWKQHPDVKSYDAKVPGDVNDPDHGPLRTFMAANGGRVAVHHVSFVARGGWSDSGGAADGEKPSQPCIRLLHVGTNDYTGTRASVHGCALNGGRESIVIGLQRAQDEFATVGRYLVEGNRFNFDRWAFTGVSIRCGGVTVQNNIGVMPDVPFAAASGASHLKGLVVLDGQGAATDDAVYSKPSLVRNNTLVNLQSSENATQNLNIFVSNEAGSLSDVTVRDNLLVGANVPNAGSLTDWSPLDAGYRPETGSAAIGAATGSAPRRDHVMDIRPESASIGALEPAD